MLCVHHLEKSRSHRVVWLLEELGLDYGLRIYRRERGSLLAPAELKQVHPLGKSPVLTDGELTVAESGAILEYLVERYDRDGRLRPPPGSAAALDYRYWLHYAEGSMMTPLILALVFARLPRQPMPFFVRPVVRGLSAKVMQGYVRPQIRTHLQFVESWLATHEWFAGTAFSAADVQMSYPLMAVLEQGGFELPKVTEYVQRLRERPAWKRTVERCGPFELPG